MREHSLFSRRQFVLRGAQLLAVGATVPWFLDRSALCMAASPAEGVTGAGAPERVLVVVQLAGGNDGLNTIVPLGNDDYLRVRTKIGIGPKEALRFNDDFGVNPAAPGLKTLFDAGHLAVVHAVGYPNPNRSHFRGTDVWTSANPEGSVQTGWLGKYCDACLPAKGAKNAPGKKQEVDPATAIAIGIEPPRALIGRSYVPLTFQSPEELTYKPAQDEKAKTAFEKLNAGVSRTGAMDEMDDDDHRAVVALPMGTQGSLEQNDETARYLQQSALNARLYAVRIQQAASRVKNEGSYPDTKFATDLKLVAQMIGSDLPTRVYYVKLAGFDTHSNQPARQQKLLDQFSGGLAAFIDDLKAMKILDRVTVMTFSEFGRRVAENGSSGTDHGEAAPLFIAGAGIKPGFHGSFPSLAKDKLHRGDVPFTTDFRSVYATVLNDWLRTDPQAVLGKPFPPLGLFKA